MIATVCRSVEISTDPRVLANQTVSIFVYRRVPVLAPTHPVRVLHYPVTLNSVTDQHHRVVYLNRRSTRQQTRRVLAPTPGVDPHSHGTSPHRLPDSSAPLVLLNFIYFILPSVIFALFLHPAVQIRILLDQPLIPNILISEVPGTASAAEITLDGAAVDQLLFG